MQVHMIIGYPSVLVIVLNYKRADDTLACLRHLYKQALPNMDILVVDNHSADGSVDRIRVGLAASDRILARDVNDGFTGGMNAGLTEAVAREYDYAWLLNNDAFPALDCLNRLIGFMDQNSKVILATPQLVGDDGREQHAGGKVDLSDGTHQLLVAGELSGPHTGPTWLTGTALLVRVSALHRVGLLDPQYFAYWEDVDFSLRVVASGGDIRAVPAAKCLHKGGSSSGGINSPLCQHLLTRNHWYFLTKHSTLKQSLSTFLRFVSSSLELAGGFALRGESRSSASIIGAVFAIIRGHYGRPICLFAPDLFVRLVMIHPWAIARLLRMLSVALEMKPTVCPRSSR